MTQDRWQKVNSGCDEKNNQRVHYENWKSHQTSWLHLEPENIQGYKKVNF